MNSSKFEHIIEAVEELRELSNEIPIIVEGKRDELSLRDLGINGEVLRVKTSLSVFEFCSDVAGQYGEVILLTDIDRAGKKIGGDVKKYLTDKGVKVNDNIGKKIMYALDTVEAEGISRRLSKLYKEFNYP